MHLPSLSQVLIGASIYVAVCSILVNVLPKDTVFNAYPRAKTAYNAGVAFLAVSALNLRKYLPAANLKIPFLGFDQYQHDHPELFAESVTDTVTASADSVTASSTHTVVSVAAAQPAAAPSSAPLASGIKPQE